MNFKELAELLGVTLEVKYYHDQRRFTAKLQDVEIMDSVFLTSAYGDGNTPEEAISYYVDRIKGTRIVIGGYTDKRREFQIPKSLTVE